MILGFIPKYWEPALPTSWVTWRQMDGGNRGSIFCFRICHFAVDWPQSIPSTWTQVSKGKPLGVVCHLKPTAMRPVTWKYLNESLHSKIGGRGRAETVGEWDLRRRIIKPDSPTGHATNSAFACLSPGSMATLRRAKLANKINEFTWWPVRVFESAFCQMILMSCLIPLLSVNHRHRSSADAGLDGTALGLQGVDPPVCLNVMSLHPIKHFNYVF